MKIFKPLLIGVLFVCNHVQAQNPLVWPMGFMGDVLDFTQGVPTLEHDVARGRSYGPMGILADSLGRLSCYTTGDTTYSGNHVPIIGNRYLGKKPRPEDKYLFIPKPGEPNTFFLFYSGTSPDYEYHVVDSRPLCYVEVTNHGKGISSWEFVSKPVQVTKTWTTTLDAHINEDGSVWVVTRDLNHLIAVRVTADSICTPIYTPIQHPFASDFMLRLSHDGTFLVTYSYNDLTLPYDTASLHFYEFDLITGEFSNQRVLFDRPTRVNKLSSQWYFYIYGAITFSPNDSFIYVSVYSARIHDDGPILYLPILRFDRYGNEPMRTIKVIKQPNLEVRSTCLKLGPDGNIYFTGGYDRGIHRIRNPNATFSDIKVEYDILKKGHKHEEIKELRFPHYVTTIKDYPSFTWSVGCNRRVLLKYQHDTSLFASYQIDYGDGNIDMQDGASGSATHQYTGDGIYLIKLRARDKMGNTLWHWDSVTVTNTPKPQALMSTDDSLACQWTDVIFKNTSKTFGVSASSITSKWSFGEGSVIQKKGITIGAISHRYANDGQYQVSLIVSNGTCKDTFTLNKRITILPAPQPGLDDTLIIGCSPLDYTVDYPHSDTFKMIEYLWGDGRQDVYGTTHAEHTFATTVDTSFMLIQRITGINGCVTSDTASILIHKGFPLDFKPSGFTSFNDRNHIELFIDSNDLVSDYIIFKDGQEIGRTSSNRFVDTGLVEVLHVPQYTLQALNRCHDGSLISKTLSPIVLSVRVEPNNESIGITWTPFLDWSKGVEEYHVELRNAQTGMYGSVGTMPPSEFMLPYEPSLETSIEYLDFRIVGVNTTLGNRSYSNQARAQLFPSIYIPNAVSPNQDELNDRFQILTTGIESYTISIFNRWGERIYEDTSVSEFQVPHDAGFLLYHATFIQHDGRRIRRQGVITILR